MPTGFWVLFGCWLEPDCDVLLAPLCSWACELMGAGFSGSVFSEAPVSTAVFVTCLSSAACGIDALSGGWIGVACCAIAVPAPVAGIASSNARQTAICLFAQ